MTSSTDERIFIGGIDPNYLNLETEVLPKILRAVDALNKKTPTTTAITHNNNINNNMDNVKYKIKDVECNKEGKYFHMTAVTTTFSSETTDNSNGSNQQSPPSSSSLLQKLIQQYHNVKWKGCRLVVQKAKPPFLLQLEMERQQQQQKKKNLLLQENTTTHTIAENTHTNAAAADCSSKNKSIIVVGRRYLKIRKRYATEKVKIDTKPLRLSVTLGSSYNNNYNEQQLIMRRRKFKSNKGSAPRGQHLVFVSEDENIAAVDTHDVSSDDDDDDDDIISTNSTQLESSLVKSSHHADTDGLTSSSDSDNHDSDGHNGNSSKPKEEEYVWSDESNNIVPNTKESKAYVWSDDDSDDDDISSSDASHNDDTTNQMMTSSAMTIQVVPKKQTAVECCCEYDYVEQDNEDDDDDENNSLVSVVDDDEHQFFAELQWQTEHDQGMNVLAQLFPDMKKKENKQKDNSAVAAVETPMNVVSQKESVRTKVMIVPRYDPTKEKEEEIKRTSDYCRSTAKNIVEQNEDDENNSSTYGHDDIDDDNDNNDSAESILASDSDDDDNKMSISEKTAENTQEKHDNNNEKIDDSSNRIHLYQQGKLEAIFQKAREEESSISPTSGSNGIFNFLVESDNSKNEIIKSDRGGGFCFGFDLHNNNDHQRRQKETSNDDDDNDDNMNIRKLFCVDNDNGTNMRQDINGDDDSIGGSHTKNEDMMMTSANMPLYPKQQILQNYHYMPDKVLNQYQNNFLLMNGDLLAIEENTVLRDEDQQEWMEERKILTQDWKRKQKRANTSSLERLKKSKKKSK